MKKNIVVVMTAILILSMIGCGKKNGQSGADTKQSMTELTKQVKLNLDRIKKELEELSADGLYVPGVLETVKEESSFDEQLEDVHKYHEFGIKQNDVPELIVRSDRNRDQMYMVLRPADGKLKSVKKKLDQYFGKKKGVASEEVDGALIYVRSNDNKTVISQIKESRQKVFGMMMDVEKAQLKETLGIEPDTIDEFLMRIPAMIVNSNTYIIAKPAEGKVKEVNDAIERYMSVLEEQWKTNLPQEYELVKNRVMEEYEGYLIYLVSMDNDAVLGVIKKGENIQ